VEGVGVDYDALLRRINETELGLEIPIKKDIRSTYTGTLITVRYELTMSIKTTFGTTNSTIKIPIIMHRCGSSFTGVVPEVEAVYAVPVDWVVPKADVPTAVLISEQQTVCDGYDTVDRLIEMVKESNQWQESSVLRDWLVHSPSNISLLTADKMYPLFQGIKGNYSYYTFCQAIGEAMYHITLLFFFFHR
jgi:hypothetical protein